MVLVHVRHVQHYLAKEAVLHEVLLVTVHVRHVQHYLAKEAVLCAPGYYT